MDSFLSWAAANKKLLYIGGGCAIILLLILSILSLATAQPETYHPKQDNSLPQREAGSSLQNGNTQNNAPESSQNSPTPVPFNTSTYKVFSQQVFPDPLSTTSSITKDGVTISSQTQADGSTKVTLHISQRGYGDVVVTAKKGETVYYTSLSYPTPPQDYGDVGLILVDQNGNIVPAE